MRSFNGWVLAIALSLATMAAGEEAKVVAVPVSPEALALIGKSFHHRDGLKANTDSRGVLVGIQKVYVLKKIEPRLFAVFGGVSKTKPAVYLLEVDRQTYTINAGKVKVRYNGGFEGVDEKEFYERFVLVQP